MSLSLYPKLAFHGIRKNGRFYTPYFLTCAGMIMMFYIIHYLAAMPLLDTMSGGTTTKQMLGLGTYIVALFALLYLFYSNSFLMRRRKKEFGLYNILGMSKANLGLVLFCETVMIAVASFVAGMTVGILLSKLAEILLTKVLMGELTYTFSVCREAVTDTLLIFLAIFTLVYLNGLRQILFSKTITLMSSESVGEKPPKANYLLGFGGAILLAVAYYMAASIKSPLTALTLFFLAVGMVIVATYLIFIAGSVMLCRILKNNKGYYYKKNHFVSVSSMAYRMKRNGAGLASVCILSTMVLVMMMATSCLYFGAEDSLNSRYPKDIMVSLDYLSDRNLISTVQPEMATVRADLDDMIRKQGSEPESTINYTCIQITGLMKEDTLILNPDDSSIDALSSYDNLRQLYVIPLDDYNRCMNTRETLKEGEVLLHCVRCNYESDTLTLSPNGALSIKKQVDDMIGNGDAAMDVIPSIFLVTDEFDHMVSLIRNSFSPEENEVYGRITSCYGFDTKLSADKQIALIDDIRTYLRDTELNGESDFYCYYAESREANRKDFYGTYGGLFFLSIILTVVFLFATVLIIYYKQLTEGYEDQKHFEIMQKVGMTKEDIRKSVNSQMLTVFFLPLGAAVLHMGFAFPMIRKLLMLFNLQNLTLQLVVTAITVLVFAVFYMNVYFITAKEYFRIVSGDAEGK